MHMQPANIHWLTFTCCKQRYFSEIPDKIILWSITVHAQQCKWHAPVLYHERTKQFHHLSDIWRALKVLHSYHLSFNFGLVGQIKQLSSNIWKLDDADKKKVHILTLQRHKGKMCQIWKISQKDVGFWETLPHARRDQMHERWLLCSLIFPGLKGQHAVNFTLYNITANVCTVGQCTYRY